MFMMKYFCVSKQKTSKMFVFLLREQQQGAEGGAEGEGHGVGDLRASVNSLLDAMRDLLSNLHLPEPPGNEADMSGDDEENEWDW